MAMALVFSIGLHWAFLQSVAWTTMLAGNLRTGSLIQALDRTFDSKHACSLCKAIAKGRQAEKKSDISTFDTKLEFVSNGATFVFTAPTDFCEPSVDNDSAAGLTREPPSPPPRRFPA
jgi:hypothetical protein